MTTQNLSVHRGGGDGLGSCQHPDVSLLEALRAGAAGIAGAQLPFAQPLRPQQGQKRSLWADTAGVRDTVSTKTGKNYARKTFSPEFLLNILRVGERNM